MFTYTQLHTNTNACTQLFIRPIICMCVKCHANFACVLLKSEITFAYSRACLSLCTCNVYAYYYIYMFIFVCVCVHA